MSDVIKKDLQYVGDCEHKNEREIKNNFWITEKLIKTGKTFENFIHYRFSKAPVTSFQEVTINESYNILMAFLVYFLYRTAMSHMDSAYAKTETSFV